MSQPAAAASEVPPRSSLVLLSLVTGAIVANINLAIANVALPSIGRDLGATQSQLTDIANGFALALACSVLYLGAIGDRYGRKLLFVLGAILTIPTAMLSAWSPSPEVLIAARFASGLAAALMFPTTMSLITALYRGKAKVHAIALWSGLGGGVAAAGPVLGGWMLEHFWWGSVFLVTLPLDVLALVVGLIVLPWHASEDPSPVDHRGGVLSVIGVAALILAVEGLTRGVTVVLLIQLLVAVAAIVLFVRRQRRARRPLVDLGLASARTFWVAGIAGAVTFGSLIGAMFIGQQFMQDVLRYDPLTAAFAVLPSAIAMAVFGRAAGMWVVARGSRPPFLAGLATIVVAFTVMLVTWRPGAGIGWVLVSFALMGSGIGLCVTPASRALMSSVPTTRAGMGSAFLDLTRDFGGSLIQAVMGVLLATVYAGYFRSAFASLPASEAQDLSAQAAAQITSGFSGAAQVAQSFPQADAQELMSAAARAFTEGKSAAIGVGLVLTVLAFGLVLWRFPRKSDEEAFYAQVAAQPEVTAEPVR